jgi:mono/diheme cytochrome c family protein
MIPRGWRAVLVAAVAGGLALGGAFAAAGAIQRAESGVSRQRPTPERWFEPSTPTSPELVTRGRKLFLDSCSHCHGADARGDEGPDLHGVQVSDRYIATIIANGIKGEMPSFARKHGADDIRALTAYLRSLP